MPPLWGNPPNGDQRRGQRELGTGGERTAWAQGQERGDAGKEGEGMKQSIRYCPIDDGSWQPADEPWCLMEHEWPLYHPAGHRLRLRRAYICEIHEERECFFSLESFQEHQVVE